MAVLAQALGATISLHVGWIVVLRKRLRDLLCQQDLIKRIQSGFRPLKFLRRASNDRSLGQIRLSDDADDHADLNKLDRRLQTRHMRVTPSNNNNDEDEENADFHEEQDGSGLGLIQPNSNLVEITRRLDREDTYRDYYSNQFDDHSQSENFYDDVDDDEVLPEVTK
ncbi:hypothetical protein BY996DRAFT_6415965 [Phakopsora pachyrhizi]|nr:hypothetical protein BY996DRAFT_6415965 [Phakopsora pachyrhizi]